MMSRLEGRRPADFVLEKADWASKNIFVARNLELGISENIMPNIA
jgi:hypothetical protein